MDAYERRIKRLRESVQTKRASQAGASTGPAGPEEIPFNELRAKAKELGVEGYGKMTKQELLEALRE